MTIDDWMKLIWLCLIRNRVLILSNKPHKSLPNIPTVQRILSAFINDDCSLEFAEAYDQLYQIVKTKLAEVNIDPRKIRGMTIDQPNNLVVYHV